MKMKKVSLYIPNKHDVILKAFVEETEVKYSEHIRRAIETYFKENEELVTRINDINKLVQSGMTTKAAKDLIDSKEKEKDTKLFDLVQSNIISHQEAREIRSLPRKEKEKAN